MLNSNMTAIAGLALCAEPGLGWCGRHSTTNSCYGGEGGDGGRSQQEEETGGGDRRRSDEDKQEACVFNSRCTCKL